MSTLARRLLTLLWATLLAFVIVAFSSSMWDLLLAGNFKTGPAFPWSVFAMAAVLWLMWQYLGGKGWPRSTSEIRRRNLRANRVSVQVLLWSLMAGILSIAALAGLWIVLFQLVKTPPNNVPSMAHYPLLTVCLVLIMASLVAPLTEEAAFRGYCQGILEREFRAPIAVAVSSFLFMLAHANHGLYWPKMIPYLLAGVVFGVIALLANSIWASIPVHFLADMTFFIFVWPHDAARRLVSRGGADGWFWLHVCQTVIFGLLAVLAFRRLARAAHTSVSAAPGELL